MKTADANKYFNEKCTHLVQLLETSSFSFLHKVDAVMFIDNPINPIITPAAETLVKKIAQFDQKYDLETYFEVQRFQKIYEQVHPLPNK